MKQIQKSKMRVLIEDLTKKYTYGYLFDKNKEDKYNTKLICKKSREEIKRICKEELKALGLKVSVTCSYYSMGSSINISIKEASFKIVNEKYDHSDFERKEKLQTEFSYLITDLFKVICNQWNYDNSDSQIDYFDTNYYLHIDYDYNLLEKQKEILGVKE